MLLLILEKDHLQKVGKAMVLSHVTYTIVFVCLLVYIVINLEHWTPNRPWTNKKMIKEAVKVSGMSNVWCFIVAAYAQKHGDARARTDTAHLWAAYQTFRDLPADEYSAVGWLREYAEETIDPEVLNNPVFLTMTMDEQDAALSRVVKKQAETRKYSDSEIKKLANELWHKI